MRVLIADDSTFMRQALARAVTEASDLEVVGRARDGREAVAMAKELRPDVITLDIEMPEMDGLTALRHIMREAPTKVLMCSSLTQEGSVQSLQALRMGAADVIGKVNGSTLPGGRSFHEEFIRRVRGLAQASRDTAPPPAPRSARDSFQINPAHYDLIVIGSSTGGPPVVETLLTALGPRQRLPIVVGQHMPAVFSKAMADRLNELCSLPVIHAQNGTSIEPGHVYICPGNEHSHIVRYAGDSLRLKVGEEPKDHLYHPSVDALFSSAAQARGKKTLAIILTGIGDDGADGAEALRKSGATVLAQDQASCVVYGMPRAVAERGLASAVMTPDEIAKILGQFGKSAIAA